MEVKLMKRMRRNILKELWWNRPTKFIPEVIDTVKRHPYEKDGNFKVYIRNILYINWQICFVR